jgi:hypothetical protein
MTLERRVDFDAVTSVLRAFEQHGVKYVVFGGVAVNLQGLTRFTEDLDVFVEPTPQNVALLKAALKDVYDDPHIDEISADDLLGDYPAVQYVPPVGEFHLDVLTRLGEAFRFDDLVAERVPLADFTVTVATPRTLFRMKRGTVRLKDHVDAAALQERFRLDEE